MPIRAVLIVLFVSVGLLFTSARPAPQLQPQSAIVYICNSKESVAYHSSKSCRGLQKCTHEVLKVTQEEAMETYGRRACKICY